MEKGEPALAPQWLRSSGNIAGGGNSTHHFASSSAHSDSPGARNRLSKSTSSHDSSRSAFLNRTPSSNSRRSSSSNGSTKHDKDLNSRAYNNFSRSHRPRDRDKEKDKLYLGDQWDNEYSDPLAGILNGRSEKTMLRRSSSMVSRKQGEVVPQGVSSEVKNNGNGVLYGTHIANSIRKVAFEKDFPSLGAEERQVLPDIGRVSSPVLSTSAQSLPLGSSALIGGEGWTSALAEVPVVIGSSSVGPISSQQMTSSLPVASSTMAGLNMAEALVQAPARANTDPQLKVDTQRREELAIKQSRQLIPMTPSMPKASILNHSDKVKPKLGVRTSEMSSSIKSGQQHPSTPHLANHSLRSGNVRSEAQKPSQTGKFLVLKTTRENGVSPTSKDVPSPTNTPSGRVGSAQLSATQSVAPAASSPRNPKLAIQGTTLEKRTSSAQVQSRHDFFNLMRKKSSTSNSSSLPDPTPLVSSPTVEDSGEVIKDGTSAPVSPPAPAPPVGPRGVPENGGGELIANGDTCEEKCSSPRATDYPVEKEKAFLRSLGWVEGSEEDDDGLTDEEINSFILQYIKMRPSFKFCRGMQLTMLLESHTTALGIVSSELSSSDSESKA